MVVSPADVTISGALVLNNSGGTAGSDSGLLPESAKIPMDTDDGKPR
ncbi:MAG: hypothetical protein V3V31_00825 [Methylococcales bacterium]